MTRINRSVALAMGMALLAAPAAAAPGATTAPPLPPAAYADPLPPLATLAPTEVAPRGPASAPRDPARSPQGTRELLGPGGSLYVDGCTGAAGDAFDVRRTSLVAVAGIAQFTLRVCHSDPALSTFSGQTIVWQTSGNVGGGDRAFYVTRMDGNWKVSTTHDGDEIPDSDVWVDTDQSPPGVETLVVNVPLDALGLPPNCDPETSRDCLRIGVASYASGQEPAAGASARDRMPDSGVPAPSWPSGCEPGIDPAAAGHVRVATTDRAAAHAVAADLRAAGYRADTYPDAPYVEVPVGAGPEVRAALEARDDVLATTPITPRRPAAVPNDPYFDDQWYLSRIQAPAAWDLRESSRGTVGIAIVDNGVASDRDDLPAERIGRGYDGLTGSELAPGTHSDLGGHGTAVAAVAAASTDDGTGMAGVDRGARIHPVRVFDHAGCFSDVGYLDALSWVADHTDPTDPEVPARERIQVVNLSLGGPAIPDEDRLVQRMVDNGAVVVAAMGNNATMVPSYPAALPEVIAVGATGGPDDTLASYTNVGRHVDVVAPGGRYDGGFSTAVLTLGDPVVIGRSAPWPTAISGTSFSAPMVSGLAALYLAEHRGATPADVLRALVTTAEDLGDGLAGFDIGYGFGMVDARRMLAHQPGQTLVRVAGSDRYETAVQASRRAFPEPDLVDVVLLATGQNYPDALAGGPLAAREHAPVLLTPGDRLHDATRDELARLSPDRVILLGGTGALSPAVEADLSRDYAVERAAGQDRYATAATIALGDPGAGTWKAWNSSDVVYLATGRNFPDALPGGAAAAAFDAPLLLTEPDTLPSATEEALWLLGPSRVVVLGGTTAIGDPVVQRLRSMGIQVDRAAGSTRYETAVAALCPVVTLCQEDTRVAVVATGEGFADALGGSAAAAALRAPLVLVPGQGEVPDLVARRLAALAPEQMVLLGGSVAIDATVEDRVRRLAVR